MPKRFSILQIAFKTELIRTIIINSHRNIFSIFFIIIGCINTFLDDDSIILHFNWSSHYQITINSKTILLCGWYNY